jgi:hypothetical protein
MTSEPDADTDTHEAHDNDCIANNCFNLETEHYTGYE